MKAMLTAAALVTTILMAASVSAHRYQMIAIDVEEGAMAALDLDSVKEIAGFKRGWVMSIIYPRSARPSSLQTLTEYDCKTERTRILVTKEFNPDNDLVREGDAAGWTYPSPASGAESALGFACGLSTDKENTLDLAPAALINAFKASIDKQRGGVKR